MHWSSGVARSGDLATTLTVHRARFSQELPLIFGDTCLTQDSRHQCLEEPGVGAPGKGPILQVLRAVPRGNLRGPRRLHRRLDTPGSLRRSSRHLAESHILHGEGPLEYILRACFGNHHETRRIETLCQDFSSPPEAKWPSLSTASDALHRTSLERHEPRFNGAITPVGMGT